MVTEHLGFAGQARASSIGEALGFASQLFKEDPVFLLEIIDKGLLVSIDPADNHEKEELELHVHGG